MSLLYREGVTTKCKAAETAAKSVVYFGEKVRDKGSLH